MSETRVLSLHQPWASLIAEGLKYIETRPWPFPEKLLGCTLYIHATQWVPWSKKTVDAGKRAAWMAHVMPKAMTDVMRANGIEYPLLWASKLPRGAVVAKCVPTASLPMLDIRASREALGRKQSHLWVDDWHLSIYRAVSQDWRDVESQRVFGDFAPGRHGFILSMVEPMEPIPLRGHQGLFRPPEGLR